MKHWLQGKYVVFYINDKTFYLASETIFEKLNFCCRAFSAYEDGCLVDSDIEHRQRLLLKEYKQKFMQLSLSDPLVVKEGWIGEKEGMSLWPKLYFMDISRYFSQVVSRENLWQRLECEYKEGKAYRYYSNGFVGEVFINTLDSESPYCVFKSKCLPSQRVSAKQYDVWVIVEKDSENPGGKIVVGYCTCTAGLLGEFLYC